MANSFGTLSVDILSQMVVDGLADQLPMLDRIASDMSTEQANKGDKITSHDTGVLTASDFSQAGGGYEETIDDLENSDLEVTLDKWKYVTYKITDEEINSTNRNLLESRAREAAYALASQVAQDLVDVVTVANGFTLPAGPIVASAEDYGYDEALEAGTVLAETRVPGPFFGLVNARGGKGLRGDTTLISRETHPTQSVVSSGVLPMVSGVDYMEFPSMADTPSDEGLFGFIGNRQSLQFMSRVPRNAQALIPGLPQTTLMADFTHERTGLGIHSRVWYKGAGELYIAFALLYGVNVGKAAYLYALRESSGSGAGS